MTIKIYDQKPQPGNLYCLNFFQYVLVKNFIQKLKYMFVVHVYWITKENYLCNGDDVTRKNKRDVSTKEYVRKSNLQFEKFKIKSWTLKWFKIKSYSFVNFKLNHEIL